LAGRTGAAEFEALKAEQVATAARLNKLQSMLDREITVRPDAAVFSALRDAYAALAAQLAELNGLVQATSHAHEQFNRELENRVDSAAAGIQHLLEHEQQTSATARALDPCYAAFEDRFRGDRSIIRARVEPYVRLVREAGAGTPETPVIDLG